MPSYCVNEDSPVFVSSCLDFFELCLVVVQLSFINISHMIG